MALKIEVVLTNEAGDESTHSLPARNEVCSQCEGEGTHLHEAIGSHAFSMEEFEREFDDEQRAAYLTRGGMYDVTCTRCQGKRVVRVVDRRACDTPELRRILKELDRQEREEAQYQQLVASELQHGC